MANWTICMHWTPCIFRMSVIQPRRIVIMPSNVRHNDRLEMIYRLNSMICENKWLIEMLIFPRYAPVNMSPSLWFCMKEFSSRYFSICRMINFQRVEFIWNALVMKRANFGFDGIVCAMKQKDVRLATVCNMLCPVLFVILQVLSEVDKNDVRKLNKCMKMKQKKSPKFTVDDVQVHFVGYLSNFFLLGDNIVSSQNRCCCWIAWHRWFESSLNACKCHRERWIH